MIKIATFKIVKNSCRIIQYWNNFPITSLTIMRLGRCRDDYEGREWSIREWQNKIIGKEKLERLQDIFYV